MNTINDAAVNSSMAPMIVSASQYRGSPTYKNSPKFREGHKARIRNIRERNDTTRLAVSVQTREMVFAIARALADCEGGRPNVQLTTKQLVADGFERYVEQPRREIAIARTV